MLTLLAMLLLSVQACRSPEKAIHKGQYKRAMNLATKKILKGKEVEQNQEYLQRAAKAIAEKTMHHYEYYNSGIEDWKRSQNKLNNSLTVIGDKNIKTQGLVSESYDMLCEAKYETDFKIVNYYYDEGRHLLEGSIESGDKSLARDAYYEFVKSEREGAAYFYDDLELLKEDCRTYGTILVVAPSELSLPQFTTRVAAGSGEMPDCIVRVNHSHSRVREGLGSEKKTKLTKTIKVGQNAVTDTAGVTTYEDILEEVEAYEIIRTLRFEGQQSLSINVTANTAHCFLRDRNETLRESEECEEISYSGDMRAVGNQKCKTCNESRMIGSVKSALRSRLSEELYVD